MYYNQYLQSKHWRKLRARKLKEQNRVCEICGKKKKLNVHHLKYKDLYSVKLSDLMVLCKGCHDEAHILIKENKKHYRKLNTGSRRWFTISRILKKKQKKEAKTIEYELPQWLLTDLKEVFIK